ncbi:MAG: AsmA family protein [Desulfatiglandaceae bacterium]
MKKTFKWVGIGVLAFCVVIIAALLLIPMFVDIQDYKPRLETMVSEKTGRDFSIGGNLELSLFPWAGISFSDLKLGNPEGYQEKNFLSIESFDARVKLLPLLSNNIQVKRFIIDGPHLVLEKSADGKSNWEGFGESRQPKEKTVPVTKEEDRSDVLPVKSLQVQEFSVKNGTIVVIDDAAGTRKTLSDLNLELQNVSLDKPVGISFSGNLDGQPLSIDGSLGPVGENPGKGPLPFDLAVKAFKQLNLAVKGKISDAATAPRFDAAFDLAPFSPRKLLEAASVSFPVKTADPAALDKLAAKGSINGSTEKISVTNGQLNLDDSTISFSIDAAEFKKPVLSFNMEIDSIDLDRYMPPPKEQDGTTSTSKKKSEPGAEIDYGPLRKPAINGTVLIKSLTVSKARVSDLSIKISARGGRYNIEPIEFAAYEGTVKAGAVLNVQKNTPSASVELSAQGVKINPALKDVLDKDFLEGTLKTEMSIAFAGDNLNSIKKSLNGGGELLFENGALIGIDLAGMVRNVTSAFGLSDKPAEKPRTDFSELTAPFTIKTGVFNTSGTTMKSPLIRLLVTGDADLAAETLDMRVEPKVVATLKGQGDTKQRSGLAVPVIVSGTFSKPKFKPDVKGILSQDGELPKGEDLKKILPDVDEMQKESLKDSAKELLKGLPFKKN